MSQYTLIYWYSEPRSQQYTQMLARLRSERLRKVIEMCPVDKWHLQGVEGLPAIYNHSNKRYLYGRDVQDLIGTICGKEKRLQEQERAEAEEAEKKRVMDQFLEKRTSKPSFRGNHGLRVRRF